MLLALDLDHRLADDVGARVRGDPAPRRHARRAHGVAREALITTLSPGPPSRMSVPGAADQDVVAGAAEQRVVAGAADQDVVAVAAVER